MLIACLIKELRCWYVIFLLRFKI